jgi:hypothetical protein
MATQRDLSKWKRALDKGKSLPIDVQVMLLSREQEAHSARQEQRKKNGAASRLSRESEAEADRLEALCKQRAPGVDIYESIWGTWVHTGLDSLMRWGEDCREHAWRRIWEHLEAERGV